MNTSDAVGWLLIGAATLAVVADWWAVAKQRRPLERVLKPVTMVLLIGVGLTLGDVDTVTRVLLVTGAVFGLAGDVALLGDSEARFMIGLSAFAVGHLAYAAAATTIGFDLVWGLAGAAFVAFLLGFRFVTRTVPGAYQRGGAVLAGALIMYALVISSMVITAWGTAIAVAAIGAAAFAVSDWVLGHELFVGPLPGGSLAVMVPYHVGQALLIVGLALS